MAIIVIGGHSRNVGKTSVTAGLIHAFRHYAWTAIKISTHRHLNIPPLPSEKEDAFDLYEETESHGSSDTSRFLAAGASRAFWVRVDGDFSEAIRQRLLPILHSSPFVIVESNRVLRFIRPDLCIMVLRYDIAEFKESAREALRQAQAVIAINSGTSRPPWEGITDIPAEIRKFNTADPQIIPGEFFDFVRERLQLGRNH